MNKITFRIVSTDLGLGEAIEFDIDGMNFIDLVREYEMPMAIAEGYPEIAGALDT